MLRSHLSFYGKKNESKSSNEASRKLFFQYSTGKQGFQLSDSVGTVFNIMKVFEELAKDSPK